MGFPSRCVSINVEGDPMRELFTNLPLFQMIDCILAVFHVALCVERTAMQFDSPRFDPG